MLYVDGVLAHQEQEAFVQSAPSRTHVSACTVYLSAISFPTDELVFIACVAVSDPPRPGVKQAVQSLQTAGIKVAMVRSLTCHRNMSSVSRPIMQ